MGKADLHIHTSYSDGMGTPAAVLEAASRAGLDLIAVTDHDDVAGALVARDLGPRYGVGVVPGVEVSTADGHLLALFVERNIRPGLPVEETALRVGDMGGLCIAAHPTARWVHSIGARRLREALADPDVARVLVGLEAYNYGLPRLVQNRAAQEFAVAAGLAQVASTDSHLLWTIGVCATEFPGRSVQALRQALLSRSTQPLIGPRPGAYFPSFGKHLLLRLAGWGYWTEEPGGEIFLRRLSAVEQRVEE
jgi:predicted metal-dependent phosphoesterase TrpH